MKFLKEILAVAAMSSMIAGAAYGWGAICVDDDPGLAHSDVGYGIVTKSPSQQAARSDAMEVCTSEGNAGCQLVLTFQNCGAYAASTVSFGVGAGATQNDAERRAMQDCGEDGCKLVVSDCE